MDSVKLDRFLIVPESRRQSNEMRISFHLKTVHVNFRTKLEILFAYEQCINRYYITYQEQTLLKAITKTALKSKSRRRQNVEFK